jgi:hypothetical protein
MRLTREIVFPFTTYSCPTLAPTFALRSIIIRSLLNLGLCSTSTSTKPMQVFGPKQLERRLKHIVGQLKASWGLGGSISVVDDVPHSLSMQGRAGVAPRAGGAPL